MTVGVICHFLHQMSAQCLKMPVYFSLKYTTKHLEKLSRKAEKDAEKEQAKVQKVSSPGGYSMYEVQQAPSLISNSD